MITGDRTTAINVTQRNREKSNDGEATQSESFLNNTSRYSPTPSQVAEKSRTIYHEPPELDMVAKNLQNGMAASTKKPSRTSRFRQHTLNEVREAPSMSNNQPIVTPKLGVSKFNFDHLETDHQLQPVPDKIDTSRFGEKQKKRKRRKLWDDKTDRVYLDLDEPFRKDRSQEPPGTLRFFYPKEHLQELKRMKSPLRRSHSAFMLR